MKTSRFSEPQILAILRQAEGGVAVPDLCREHGMSTASFYKWRAKYGGMDASMISQMKALEDENHFDWNADAGPSSPFEELVHYGQYKSGQVDIWTAQHGLSGAVSISEYEAAYKLVQNASAYGIGAAENAENIKRWRNLPKKLSK